MRYRPAATTILGLVAATAAPKCGAFQSSFQGAGADARSSAASAATYAAVLGLGVLAIHKEGSMNDALVQMKTSSAAAAELRAGTVRDADAAHSLEREADAEGEAAADLLADAKELGERGTADEVEASEDEREAEALRDRAGEEEKESGELLALADSDETTYGSIEENATALSEMADEDRAAAESIPDVRICRFWIFQSICDALGTAARVRSEFADRAAEEAREAAEEFARAKAVKDREEEERQKAHELEARAKDDESEADSLEEKAAEIRKRAEDEEREAEKDEMDAQAEEEKREEEAGEAKALEAKAEDETNRANGLLEQSMQHGKIAYRNGVLAAVFAGIVLAFFALRLIMRYLLQVAWGMVDYFVCLVHERQPPAPAPAPNVAGRAWASFPKQGLCRFLFHCIGAIAVLATFSGEWMEVETYSIRNRGGLVLFCSCLAGATQSLAFCALPRLYSLLQSTDMECEILLEGEAIGGIAWETAAAFARGFVFVTALFAMEIEILWINLGPELFGNVTQLFNVPLFWCLFVLGSLINFMLFERCCFDDFTPNQAGSNQDQRQCSGVATREREQYKLDSVASERDALIKSDRSIGIGEFEIVVDYAESLSDGEMDTLTFSRNRSDTDTTHEDSTDASMEAAPLSTEKTFGDLQLPFEILVVSCMAAILRACVPKCRQLLPVVHSSITPNARHSTLQGFAICTLFGVLILAIYFGVKQSYRRRRLSSQHQSPALYQEL